VDKLLETEADSKIADPTAAELQAYYKQQKGNASESFDQAQPRLKNELKQIKLRSAREAYLKVLRDSAVVRIFLEPPKVKVNYDPSRLKGNANAPITIVEFADFAIPPSMDDTLHQLQLAGLSPILTHPERNALLRTKPQKMYRWLHQGCYAQITALSLLGRFGSSAQHRAEQWLDEDRIHFVASDAHNVKGRPLQLRAAFDVVAKRRGEEVAQALFRDNPLAAFEGRSLPYEPEQLDPSAQPPQYRRRKRFLFF